MTSSDKAGVCIVFSTVKWDIVSWLIRVHTNCKQSHVELENPYGWTLGSRFSLWGKICRFLHIKKWSDLDGVQLRPPSASRHHSSVIRVWFENDFNSLERMWKWIEANRLDYPYDLRGIFGMVAACGWDDSRARFCSEVIDEGLENALNTVLFRASCSCITPRDLLIVLSNGSGLAMDVDGPPFRGKFPENL